MIKKKSARKSVYISKILSVLKSQMQVLDVGCGTAHIIQELTSYTKKSMLIGFDVSPVMIRIAKSNLRNNSSIELVEGDGHRLPFSDNSFDVVMSRLADYSIGEVYRVLRRQGYFFEYSLGPEADKEIKEFFPDRIERKNFFFPKDLENWKEEVCEDALEAGFTVSSIEDYIESERYKDQEELMDLIEMVPLVKDFNRKNDVMKVQELAKKYGDEKGVKTTWHYYIMMVQKP